MAAAPESVLKLVDRFDRNREAYRSASENGDWLKRAQRDVPVPAFAPGLIDPLFIALGWDVRNKAGYAEAYKDVVHEDAIKVGGTTTRWQDKGASGIGGVARVPGKGGGPRPQPRDDETGRGDWTFR